MKTRSKIILLALVLLLATIPALADWHTATVATGNEASSIAVDPVRNRVFTANTLSGTAGTVTVIDGRTNETQTWTAGAQPTCLAFNPVNGHLYVSINGSATNDTLVVFDTLGNILKKLPVKKDPSSMVIDADNDRLYVANNGSDTISIFASDTLWLSYPVNNAPYSLTLNPVNHALFIRYTGSDTIGTLNLGYYSIMHFRSGDGAQDITVNASVNKAYVANTSEDSVTVFDCSAITPVFLKKIKVGDGPVRLVSDPGAKRVYVANINNGLVTAINCSTNTAVLNVPVGISPVNMAINSVTGKLYVGNNNAHNALRIIDWRNGGTQDSIVLSHPPQRVALNPITNKVYVTYDAGNPDSLAVIDGADFDTTLVQAKANTYDVVVNPINGDAYATNSGSDNVTVIKANGDTATIAVGDNPQGLAVNPLTNKVFVCNVAGKSVSVINGTTYAVERTITVDTLPTVVAVNPLTNYIYVNSYLTSANRIKVIDGKDWDTSSVQVGLKPFSIGVNPATNRIYVGNDGGNSITVIDGSHHTVITTITSITRPYRIEANPVTNKIYCVGLSNAGRLTVIDGATNASVSIVVGNWPNGVAVNRANNKIYVSNYNDNNVMVIDGATNTVTGTITVGTHPWGMAADPVTGKVFVCNNGSANVSVIDCASGSAKTIATGTSPQFLAVNPATGKVYVACNIGSGVATIIDQTVEQDTKVNTYDGGTTWKNVLPGNSQNRGVTTINHWSPYKTTISRGLISLATNQSYWKFESYLISSTDSSRTWATGNSWGADTAIYGDNIYRRYAIETQAATTNNLGMGTPFVGNIIADVMYRLDYPNGPAIAWWDSLPDDNTSADGYGPYTVKAVITDFSGIDTANLYYELNAVSMPRVKLTRGAADTFSAVIPATTVMPESTKTIFYNLHAWDHAHNPYGTANYGSISARHFFLRNITGVAGGPAAPALPMTFALQAAYPNPSRGQTVIRYQLPKASVVQLQVYNIAGHLVKSFNEGAKPAGYHQINWSNGSLSNGIYFYKLRAGEFSDTRKMIVVK